MSERGATVRRFLTRRRRLQVFAAAALIALPAAWVGWHEFAIGVIVVGLVQLPSDWMPPA